MNPFAAAAQLLGNLAGLTQQWAFVYKRKVGNGEYVGGIVTGIAGDAGTLVGLVAVKTFLRDRIISRAAMRERLGPQGVDWVAADYDPDFG